MRSALPPKLAAALGEKPRANVAPGPESTTQVKYARKFKVCFLCFPG